MSFTFSLLAIAALTVNASIEDVPSRSHFWDYMQENEEIWVGDEDYYPRIEACAKKIRAEAAKPLIDTRPVVKRVIRDSQTGEIMLVLIDNAITSEHSSWLDGFSHCLRQNLPDLFQRRSLQWEMSVEADLRKNCLTYDDVEEDYEDGSIGIQNETINADKQKPANAAEDKSLGGNDTTYLHPLVGIFFPELVEVVRKIANLAFDHSDWKEVGYYEPNLLGMRTMEYMEYRYFNKFDEHTDDGSLYTVNIPLRDPHTDFQGGQFFIKDSVGKRTYLTPDQYSAVVFLAHSIHGITEIEGGDRRVFSSELWMHDDSPLSANRPLVDAFEWFHSQCVRSNVVDHSWNEQFEYFLEFQSEHYGGAEL